MTDHTLARLTRVLAHHSETLQIISRQLAELSEYYAALSSELESIRVESAPEPTPEPELAPSKQVTPADMMRSAEAAEYLGLRRSTLAKYRQGGGGPEYVRLGKGARSPVAYRKTDLDQWIESHRYKLTSDED